MRKGKWGRFEKERERECVCVCGKKRGELTLVRLHDDPDLGTDAAVDELWLVVSNSSYNHFRMQYFSLSKALRSAYLTGSISV